MRERWSGTRTERCSSGYGRLSSNGRKTVLIGRTPRNMDRAVARQNGTKFEGDIETTPRQVHNNILTSAGIDPTTEPWVSHIELAIKDEDPTRVLIDCQHKVVMKHPGGDPMLDRLALERANPKIIGCNLHRYASDGLELDNI